MLYTNRPDNDPTSTNSNTGGGGGASSDRKKATENLSYDEQVAKNSPMGIGPGGGAGGPGGGTGGATKVAGNDVPYLESVPLAGEEFIADLTVNGGAASLDDPNIKYVHLKAGGQDLWLDLAAMEPAARAQVVETLATSCARKDFNPETSFVRKGDSLVLGGSRMAFDYDANTDSAKSVLERSNDPKKYDVAADKAVFDFLNEESNALNAEDAPADKRVGPQEKPASWYNGYVIEGDWAVPVKSDWDKRDGPLPPKMKLDEYQAMLCRDFNFDGAIDTLNGLGGEPAFVAAMKARFGQGHPLGDAAFESICHEVWAYCTTGMDSSGTTDIAVMQALLDQLSPDISNSNDTNTPLTGAPFQVPGTEVVLNRGDGKHGRATVMETRHLLAGIMGEIIGPDTLDLTQGEELVGERDFFVVDASESGQEQWDNIDKFTNDQKGWTDGQGMKARTLGYIYSSKEAVLKEGMTPDKVNTKNANTIKDAEEGEDEKHFSFDPVLTRAWELLVGGKTSDHAEVAKFASHFGMTLTPKDLRLKYQSDSKAKKKAGWKKTEGDKSFEMNARGVYTPAWGLLRGFIGDTAENSNHERDMAKDSVGESAFKGMLATMLYSYKFDKTHLDQMRAEGAITPRLNAVIDEPEQSLEYLGLATAVADYLGIECRIVALDNVDVTAGSNKDLSKSARFIDIHDIRVNTSGNPSNPDFNTVEFDYTQNGAFHTGEKANIDENLNDGGWMEHRWIAPDGTELDKSAYDKLPRDEQRRCTKKKNVHTGSKRYENSSVTFSGNSRIGGGGS